MVAKHGDLIADTGQHTLSAAGEAGEEVRLDKAFSYEQLSLYGHLVNYAGGAGRKDADLHIAVGVAAVVHDDLAVVVQLLAHFEDKLFLGAGAVEAGGNQQGNIDVGVTGLQLGVHVGQNVAAGHGTGVVGYDDNAVFLAFCKLTESGAVDGIFHGGLHDGKTVALGLELVDAGAKDACAALVVLYYCLTIRNMYHSKHLLYFVKRGTALKKAYHKQKHSARASKYFTVHFELFDAEKRLILRGAL